MPNVAGHRRRRSRAERRERQRSNLFDALERLLEVSAFPEITIPRILDEAQISRATFYLYFDNTASLLLETAETVFADVDQVISAWWLEPSDLTLEDLEQTIRRVFDRYREHKHVLRALADAAGYEPAVRVRMSAMHQRYIDGLAEHIERGRAHGQIRDVAPVRATASWIIWMFERGLYQLVADAPPSDLGEQVEALAGLIWHGLYQRSARRPYTSDL